MYKIFLGWKGLVWTSGVPGMAVIAPATWTPQVVEAMVGDFHCQCFTMCDTLTQAWDRTFGLSGYEALMVDWVYWMSVNPV